jgi:glycosyltransferase involved in cell wall biosynthesis
MPQSPSAGARGSVRLLVAIGSLGTGGSERQLTELLTRLPRDRFEPVVLTFDGDDPVPPGGHRERLRAAGVPVTAIRLSGALAPRRVAMVRRALRAVNRLSPDVIYAWLDETAALLAPIARLKRIPCLVARRNLIGSSTERNHPRLRPILARAEASARLVTANSAAVAANCAARGHRPDRIRTVRNGHDAVDPLPLPPTAPVVFGYVAQLRPEKGHHGLLDAAATLPAGGWRVDLAGDGPMRDELEARVTAGGLGDRIRFLGPISDVRAFWRERHVALLLSDSEGLPNALLEAAFAGRPAIATSTGGTPEVVGPGGILTPLHDPLAVSRAMSSLIADGPRREDLGRAAYAHVSTRYTMDGMVSDHIRAIEETLDEGRERCR